jgi:Icc-related predicted phosphoesterase
MPTKHAFFATDLHGSEVCFRKFLNAAEAYGAEILIWGGDVTGKMMIPVVAQQDETYRVVYEGAELYARSRHELATLCGRIRNAGCYPIQVDAEEIEAMGDQEVEQRFEQEMRRVLERWVTMAEERLSPRGVRCVAIPGNDDQPFVDSIFADSGFVENADGRVIDLDGAEIVGLGNANPTPWACPRDVPEESLEEKIEAAVADVTRMERCIFDFHVPPFDSQLDLCPEVDSMLRPVMSGGQFRLAPAGSTAVRKAIERYQPLAGVHGHIHEGRGVSKIGRTVCVNPGSEYQSGVLTGCLLVVSKKGRLTWTLTTG